MLRIIMAHLIAALTFVNETWNTTFGASPVAAAPEVLPKVGGPRGEFSSRDLLDLICVRRPIHARRAT